MKMNDENKYLVRGLTDFLIENTFSYFMKNFPEKMRLDDALNIMLSGFISSLHIVLINLSKDDKKASVLVEKQMKMIWDLFDGFNEIEERKFN